MASRTEWRFQDRGSGPAYKQLVVVHDDDSESTAYGRLMVHCAACRTCLTVNDAGEATNICTIAEQLYQEYRQARRGPAAALPPAPA
ncbi:hypothetical protein ABZU86_26505 [Streptomyces sp. NPDC005271]|uniref:hypothetical protein n=1 Tax=unclassified Streptomyces TaxID=2593676 RepID=UPI0033B441AA